ncbi:hypothetical protein AAVH_40976, partial [Aphelenchoides avenae]
TAVKVLAAFLLVLHVLDAFVSVCRSHREVARIVWPAYSLLTLVFLLDLINACWVQKRNWYIASAVFWAVCVYTCIVVLGAYTILAITVVDTSNEKVQEVLALFWLGMLAEIVLLITYFAALRSAARVQMRQLTQVFMQSLYAPLEQDSSPPMSHSHADHSQQFAYLNATE